MAKRVDMDAFKKDLAQCYKYNTPEERLTCAYQVSCGKYGQEIRRAAKEFDPILNADVEIECKKP